jgi:hypothetical protein
LETTPHTSELEIYLKFVPRLLVNLSFSISKALKNGFNLGNGDGVMKLMKENTALHFDRVLKTKNGFVSDIKLIPIFGKTVTNAVELTKVKNNFDNLLKIISSWASVARIQLE